MDANTKLRCQGTLSAWWGINDRASLQETLTWLSTKGHRAEFTKIGQEISSMSPSKLANVKKRLHNNAEALYQVAFIQKYYTRLGKKSLLAWDLVRYIAVLSSGIWRWIFLRTGSMATHHASRPSVATELSLMERSRRQFCHRAQFLEF